ncbi:I78 family peptidase inhibitor [Celeribacter sp.]|uniref:I78 family peptidase inhibitor n=1 Tax=Celeribacter sp. TaxID=1890673 RepID=UPI003A90EEA9
MKHLALCLIALTALSGCQQETSDTSVLPEMQNPAADSCAKDRVTPFIGEDRSVIATLDLPDPVRVIAPGAMITKDYRLNRTNIDLDADGHIVRAWCG